VRHGDTNSGEFKALIGLLTGDPASPVLWNFFMADLVMLPDLDDMVMENVRMAMMAEADDVLLISLSAQRLHAKLKTLQEWCAINFIPINILKTIILIFGGTIPTPLPVFTLGNTAQDC
jgi:hypothetical protein